MCDSPLSSVFSHPNPFQYNHDKSSRSSYCAPRSLCRSDSSLSSTLREVRGGSAAASGAVTPPSNWADSSISRVPAPPEEMADETRSQLASIPRHFPTRHQHRLSSGEVFRALWPHPTNLSHIVAPTLFDMLHRPRLRVDTRSSISSSPSSPLFSIRYVDSPRSSPSGDEDCPRLSRDTSETHFSAKTFSGRPFSLNDGTLDDTRLVFKPTTPIHLGERRYGHPASPRFVPNNTL